MTLNDSRDIDLVNSLLATGHETEWLEFKHDQGEGKVIGKLCSALSNGARIHGKEKGYCLWGIDDKTCKVVGTKFDPYTKKCGGQNFQLWLESNLKPDSLSIRFREIHHPEGRKTIMAGLLVKELIARSDIERCLVVAPGSLVEQWQDELGEELSQHLVL